jgi:hypothetical protein
MTVYQCSHCRKPVVPLPDWCQGQASSMPPVNGFERFPRLAVGVQVRPRREAWPCGLTALDHPFWLDKNVCIPDGGGHAMSE